MQLAIFKLPQSIAPPDASASAAALSGRRLLGQWLL